MRASKGTLLVALAGSIVVATGSAVAGPSSPLDPYAYIQAPRPVPRQQAPAKNATRPAVSVPGPGVVSGVKDIGGGIVSTTKAATSALVGGSKKAGAGIVKGGKAVGEKFVAGSKKLGTGLAGGAKASGSFLARGAKSVGHGMVAAGETIKEGTQAAGAKVSSVPRAAGGGNKSNPQKLAEDLKAAPDLKAAQPEQPQQPEQLQQPRNAAYPDASGSLVGKVVAVPRAIGLGVVAGAGKVKDGTAAVGKKMVVLPLAVGKGFGKILNRGGQQPATATAQAPGAATPR